MNVGKKIKELRKQRDITQERLAEYLNISTQAVSKWENGISLPDITLITPIASFFGVTTDELLSYNRENEDKKLREYKKQIEKLRFNYDTKGISKVCREALKKYPGQYYFMIRLAQTLPKSEAEEIVSLCETVYDDCTDEELRQEAKVGLCRYYPLVGRKDDALTLSKTLLKMDYCRELTLEWLLDGDESIQRNQNNIVMLVEYLVERLIYLSSAHFKGNKMSFEKKIKCAEAALQIYSTVFYEGHTAKNSGQFRHIYERMAELYCMVDKDKAIEMLRLAAESAIAYDKQIDCDENYTSMLVCDIKCSHKDYSDTVRLIQLMEQRKAFDVIREHKEYQDIKMLLKVNS